MTAATSTASDWQRRGHPRGESLARQPGIDASRTIVADQSFGGWTTLALGTMAPPGVRDLVEFSPALRASDCSAQDRAMVDGARAFCAHAKLPSLWFFGDNDSIMPVAEWHTMFDAYNHAGGHATLVSVGHFMTDSHQILSVSESLPLWTPRVDAFLANLGLPAAELYPEYLPIPPPAPTHFAAVDDVHGGDLHTDTGLQRAGCHDVRGVGSRGASSRLSHGADH